MRYRISFHLSLLILIIGGACQPSQDQSSTSSTNASTVITQVQTTDPPTSEQMFDVADKAVDHYGWALPICIKLPGLDATCTTIGTLTLRDPEHGVAIAEKIHDTAREHADRAFKGIETLDEFILNFVQDDVLLGCGEVRGTPASVYLSAWGNAYGSGRSAVSEGDWTQSNDTGTGKEFENNCAGIGEAPESDLFGGISVLGSTSQFQDDFFSNFIEDFNTCMTGLGEEADFRPIPDVAEGGGDDNTTNVKENEDDGQENSEEDSDSENQGSDESDSDKSDNENGEQKTEENGSGDKEQEDFLKEPSPSPVETPEIKIENPSIDLNGIKIEVGRHEGTVDKNTKYWGIKISGTFQCDPEMMDCGGEMDCISEALLSSFMAIYTEQKGGMMECDPAAMPNPETGDCPGLFIDPELDPVMTDEMAEEFCRRWPSPIRVDLVPEGEDWSACPLLTTYEPQEFDYPFSDDICKDPRALCAPEQDGGSSPLPLPFGGEPGNDPIPLPTW
jgi:hypothetical protein